MRFAVKIAASIVLAAALPAIGEAQEAKYGTGRFFYDHCKAVLDQENSKELYRQGECSGILGAMSYFSEQLPRTYRFCSPADTTTGQLARTAVEYMEKHPEKLDQHITLIAAAAFQATWPCRK